MIVLSSTTSAWFDCDDTLVMWNPTPEEIEKNGIEIDCPSSFTLIDGEAVPSGSWKTTVVPHKAHVEQLKKHKMRGHLIVVWSAGGWDWAQQVVKALQLESFVDLVISKPTWVFDDLPVTEFMPQSMWLEDK